MISVNYMSTEYTKRDIAKILELSVRKVTFWTDFGLVIPDIKPSRGKGRARLYSERNLIEFAMIDILINQVKISLNNVRYIFESLRRGYQRELNEELTTQYLVKYGSPPRFETFFTQRAAMQARSASERVWGDLWGLTRSRVVLVFAASECFTALS